MKRTTLALALILNSQLLMLNSSAAVPLSWTVETTRATPAVFEAYQGETIEFSARLQSGGKPLAAPADCSIYWQTNGMGSAYWSAPASATSNLLSATWSPSMDVGARVYNCFIGSPSNNYHAAFQLRLRPSPGATPNALPLPTPVIDFAKVTVLNPPWPTNAVPTVESVREIAGEVVAPVAASVSSLASSKLDESTFRTFADQITDNVNVLEIGHLEYGQRFARDEEEIRSAKSAANAAQAAADAADAKADAADAKADAAQSAVANKADKADVEPLAVDIRNAYLFSQAINLYMTGNTNAWFSGTNYVFGADAASRTRFAWEDGMDAATVPCSMSLWEIRDGAKQQVWDQRDWPVWYWNFKAAQMRSEMAVTNKQIYAAIENAVTNEANHAWARRYAATGRVNPDPTTTFIDTPTVTLSPGMNWETVATVGGCGYWTIVGNGAIIGGSGTNAVLTIKDFEGNEVLSIAKGEHRLAWLEKSDFTGQMYDANMWVCFDMLADVQPKGYFSITLHEEDFVAEDDPSCPAQYRWENIGNGQWRIHFLLKPGIDSNVCFSKFQVEIEGKTQVRYSAGLVIQGGLVYEGVTIAPVIPQNANVGDTITWKVVAR